MLKELFKDSMIYGFSDAVFKALRFLTFPIFAHLLTVEQYGIIELALTFSTLSAIFYIGIHNAVQRYYWEPEITSEERSTLVSTGLTFLVLLTVFVSSIFMILTLPFQNSLKLDYNLEWYYIAIPLAAILPSQICIFAQCVLRLHFAPWKFALLSAALNLSSLILSLIFLLWLQWGILGFLTGNLIANIATVPLGIYMMRNELKFKCDFQVLKEIITFGYPFIFTSVAYWIFGGMDKWMIGWLSDVQQVGLYSVAFKITMILNIFKAAFSQAWSPHALKIYSHDTNYHHTYSRVLTLWFYFLMVVGTAISLFSPEFFRLTTPQEYWDVTSIVIFTVGGLVLHGTTEVTAVGISIKRKTFIFTRGSWLSAGVNFLLNYLLIPTLGAMGAAIATLISYGVLTSYYLYHSQKLNPIPLEKKRLLLTVSLLIFSIGVCYQTGLQPLSVELALLKGGYLILLMMVAPITGIFTLPRKLQFMSRNSRRIFPHSTETR